MILHLQLLFQVVTISITFHILQLWQGKSETCLLIFSHLTTLRFLIRMSSHPEPYYFSWKFSEYKTTKIPQDVIAHRHLSLREVTDAMLVEDTRSSVTTTRLQSLTGTTVKVNARRLWGQYLPESWTARVTAKGNLAGTAFSCLVVGIRMERPCDEFLNNPS